MTPGTDTAEIDLQPLKESLPAEPDANVEPQREIVVRTLDQFAVDPETNGQSLLGNRFLCRGGGLLFCGPTGVGKSSWSLQGAIAWALGRPHFCIKPAKPLTSLVVNGEDDDGDMAERRDGIYDGLELSAEVRADVGRKIKVVCESSATGDEFIKLVDDLVSEHRPDLILVDPLFSFCGCNVSDQGPMSHFLRNGLNTVLRRHGCGLILTHHTNKPKFGKEKPDWQAGDFAYLGAGTAELANWARAVVAIRSIGSHTIFQVQFGKRGRRAGLVDDEGRPAYSFYAMHSPKSICWIPATEDDIPTDDGKHAITVKDVVAIFGDGLVLQYSKLVETLVQDHGVSERTAKAAVARAKVQGAIHKSPSGIYEASKPKGAR